MSQPPTIAELRQATGISPSYASMILSGARSPSRRLAIRIFRETGWRHGLIAHLTDEQVSALEAIETGAQPVVAALDRNPDTDRQVICVECDQPVGGTCPIVACPHFNREAA